MRFLSIVLLHAIKVALVGSLSMPGCQEKCGNVTIPYPFGIGSNCSADSNFTVICKNSTTAILSSINMEALNISLLGTVVVKQPVSPMKCSVKQSIGYLPVSFEGSPFTISARYNSLAVIGCQNSVWFYDNKTTNSIGGCTAMCDDRFIGNSCNGINCCQTRLPPQLKELNYTYKTNEANSNDSSCGYIFPVDKRCLNEGGLIDLLHNISSSNDQESGFAPLLLEWEYGETKGYSDRVCTYSDDYCLSYPDEFGQRYTYGYSEACTRKHIADECRLYPNTFVCKFSKDRNLFDSYYSNMHSYYYDGWDYASSSKYCSCPHGYEGNPYLPQGCTDVDECRNETEKPCGSMSCVNTKGYYTCKDLNAKFETGVRRAFSGINIAFGALVLLLVGWKSKNAIRKRIKAKRRRKFFKRNGGLLLEQQLSATEKGLDKTRVYSSNDLIQATDHFNENRVLGRGGQGTVYKGMLKDGRIVAVKKSKRVEEDDLEVFINEVVILSQVNHRNVVKLLGCCLETDVPLLVYEFIPKGTLFQHIHEPSEEFLLTWEMRVRIAREVAGALAYLHSSASAPIYHRDIKSTNILLDDRYCAKISDFGTSRSIAIDQTHLTTRVQGTFGYFDPEYFQSSQFTDKSDVYSFGVVMVELLTGEKAISSSRVQLGMNLAMHFLNSMEGNQLFEILDARVLQEGKREEISVVAHLARRCLHPNGRRRPTMKEVAAELESLNQDGSREYHAYDVSEFQDFSSTSGSMHSDCVTPNSPEA